MRYNNARWRVVQVEPLEFSTIVDNGIILRGLFQLVRGGGVRPYVLHLREGFFYGDYYSGAVMCGTMAEVKRVTRKCVLESKHLRGLRPSRVLYLCGSAWSRLSQMRHNVFSLID